MTARPSRELSAVSVVSRRSWRASLPQMRSKIICNYSTFHRAGKRLPSREVSGTGITLGSLDVHGNSCLSLRVTAERNGTRILDGGMLVQFVSRQSSREPFDLDVFSSNTGDLNGPYFGRFLSVSDMVVTCPT